MHAFQPGGETGGYAVTVIAPPSADFDQFGTGFKGMTVLGDGTQTEVLEQAKIEDMQVLIALTNRDNQNLLISQVATSLYHVPQMFCGLQDPDLEACFKGVGSRSSYAVTSRCRASWMRCFHTSVVSPRKTTSLLRNLE